MEVSSVARSSLLAQGKFSSARAFVLSTVEQAHRLEDFGTVNAGFTHLQTRFFERNIVVCHCGKLSSQISSEGLRCRFYSGRGVETRGARHNICKVARQTRVQAAKAGAAKEVPPSSREEALQQARTSLALLLEKALQKQNKKSKDRGGAKGPRLTVELPVLDTSPSSTLRLTQDVFQGLVSYKVRDLDVAVYFGDSDTADLATSAAAENPKGWLTHALGATSVVPDRVSLVVLVGPREEQLSAVDNLLETAGSRPIVALNPEWYPESILEEDNSSKKTAADLFEVCYSYLPLKIQGFFGSSEGAVLKFVTSGAPAGAPWLIFVKEKEELKIAIRLKKRPNAGDLEQAFYIKSAAESPVAKSVNFVRGLASMITKR